MNAIVDDPALKPGPLRVPSLPHTAPDVIASRTMRKPAHLDRGDTLRIRDGRGLRVAAVSGIVWITEEGSPRDTVLLPGDSHRIEHDGTALALAHRAARLTLELPRGVSPPRRVDVVLPDGTCIRRVAFAARSPWSLRALIVAMKQAMRGIARADSRRAPAPQAVRPLPYY